MISLSDIILNVFVLSLIKPLPYTKHLKYNNNKKYNATFYIEQLNCCLCNSVV